VTDQVPPARADPAPPAEPRIDDPRLAITVARRILHREGCDSHVGGQVTARAADGSGFWATGFTYFDQGGPEDVALLDWELEVREGRFDLARAMGFHRAIYVSRPDVGAIVHLHSPHVTALSSLGRPVGMFDVTAVCFAGDQAVHADDGVRPHVEVAASLGDRRVVLMQNHGAIVASDSLPHAVVEAITLERCARIDLLASAAGGAEIAPAEVDAGHRNFRPLYLRNMWEANVARLLDADPALAGLVRADTTTAVPHRAIAG
jgi:L-fuculose-phosphate aldolase